MGSSGSSNYSPSASPSPPANMISSPGSTAGGNIPSYPSFLPSVPGQMATGLTPQMIAQIEGTAPARPQSPVQGGGGGGFGYAQLLDFFNKMPGGGSNVFTPRAQDIIRQGNSAGRENIQAAARNMFFGVPMPANIPAPPSGASGADIAAYNAARQQDATRQREALARVASMSKSVNRYRPGGSR